ncbi:hypothetical protein GCM10022221_76790 [Actinocorallia aurea]
MAGAITMALVAVGCGNDTGPGTDRVTSITALDYYTDEPEHSQWNEMLAACGKSVGVKV